MEKEKTPDDLNKKIWRLGGFWFMIFMVVFLTLILLFSGKCIN